jgi:hypothetical protein
LNKMKTAQSCKVWTLSSDRNEYERFAYLLGKPDESGLCIAAFNELLQERAVSAYGDPCAVTVVHDPCDIRKPYAQQMECLDTVRSLQGQTVNGYQTFNSVVLEKDRIHLAGCLPYSRKEGGAGVPCDEKPLMFSQMRELSLAFKAGRPERVVTHVIDREADDAEFFRFIDQEMQDRFVIRLKLNRNSDVKAWEEKGQREAWLKLAKKPLANRFEQVYREFRWKGRTYKQARAVVSHEHIHIGNGWYWAVRVELLDKLGRPIFKDPMQLLTNHRVHSDEVALYVYHTYLKRSKIEGVFKFLKDQLGWEEFQVRDLLAIKHIIMLCYFVGAYFFEAEPEITKNEYTRAICRLGGGKGKATRHFFLKGLEVMAHYHIAQQFFKEHDVSPEQLSKMLSEVT